MIAKEKSQKMKQLKYLLLIPLLAGMLIYTSCIEEANDELFEMEAALNNVNSEDFKGGIYFDFEIGKTYVGNSLMIGRYLELSEYTEKEKEITEKFNNNEEFLFVQTIAIKEELLKSGLGYNEKNATRAANRRASKKINEAYSRYLNNQENWNSSVRNLFKDINEYINAWGDEDW